MAKVAWVQTVAPATTGGTQDITSSALGGATPTAAVFFWAKATAADTTTADIAEGIGFCTASAQGCCHRSAEDNAGTTNCWHTGSLTKTILLWNKGQTAVLASATFDSFITNGVRIQWATGSPSAQYRLGCLLIVADNVDLWHFQSNNHTIGQQTTRTLSFEPKAWLCLSGKGDLTEQSLGSGIADAYLGLGMAANYANDSIEQRSCQSRSENARPRGRGSSGSRNTRVGIGEIGQDGTPVRSIRMVSASGSGYTIEAQGNGTWSATQSFLILALGFNSTSAKVFDFAAPTTVSAKNGPGTQHGELYAFEAALVVQTPFTGFGSNSILGEWSWGGWHTADSNAQGAFNRWAEHNAGPTNEKIRFDASDVIHNRDEVALRHEARASSHANGIDLNFTTVTGAAEILFAIGFEEDTGGGPITGTATTANYTYAANDATPVVGAVTKAATTANYTYAANDAVAVPGAVTAAATTADYTYQANDAAAVVGAVTAQAQTANYTYQAGDATPAPGAVTAQATAADYVYAANDASAALTGFAQTANYTYTANEATPVPGAVTAPAATADYTYAANDATAIVGAVTALAQAADYTYAANAATPVPGAVTGTAQAADYTYTANDAAAVPGAVAATSTTANYTYAAGDAAPIPGAVTALAQAANYTYQANDGTAVTGLIGTAQTANYTYAAGAASPVAGAVTRAATTADYTYQAGDASPVPGAVTATAQAAAYTYTANDATGFTGVTGTAVTAVYTYQANDAAPVPGAVTAGAATSVYTYAAQDAVPQPGAVTRAAQAANYTYGAQAASPLPGAVTASAATADYTYAAQDATGITGGDIVAEAATATYTYQAQAAVPVPGAVTSAAAAANYTYAAQDATAAGGVQFFGSSTVVATDPFASTATASDPAASTVTIADVYTSTVTKGRG